MKAKNLGMGLCLSALMTIGVSSIAQTKTIPVIGIDRDGNEVIQRESVPKFKGKLDQAYRVVSKSSLDALNRASRNGNDFKLKGLEVGVGIFGEIGLGDVIKASAEPTLIFVYSRKSQGRAR